MASRPDAGNHLSVDHAKVCSNRRRWLRLPSFASVIGAMSLICVAFVVWPAGDAQYRSALAWFRILAGLRATEGEAAFRKLGYWDELVRMSLQWDHLGSRLLLLASLAGLAIGASSVAVVHVFKRPTARRVLALVLIGALSLVLWLSYDRLLDHCAIQHARRALPRFRIAAAPLIEKWPIESGALPEAGSFEIVPRRGPNLLFFRSRLQANYPRTEDFGAIVERSESGAVRFDLSAASDAKIEHHPPRSAPRSYASSTRVNFVLVKAVSLDDDGWYFVRYGAPDGSDL
jgi:hypothetical protein